MTFFFHFILTLISSAQAQNFCWDLEVNPYTKSNYTQEEWYEHVEKWEDSAPPSPGLWSLYWAHQTYKNELSTANTLKGDKRKHCYIGCRIAQDSSIEVSTYVGWLKESDDIQDCDKKTFFEPLDFLSTIDGAKQSSLSSDPESCYEYCQNYKAPKNRSEL